MVNEQIDLLKKSIDITQGSISRMSENSFKLKRLFIPIFSALIFYFNKYIFDETNYIISLADIVWCTPLLLFIYLDAYYLLQERLFRSIYEDFVEALNEKPEIRKPFDLKPSNYQRNEFSIWNAIFSVSVSGFYSLPICSFQFFIFYHKSCWLLGAILPLAWAILGFIMSKKTTHNK